MPGPVKVSFVAHILLVQWYSQLSFARCKHLDSNRQLY